MDYSLLPENPMGRRIRWDSFPFGRRHAPFLRCVACVAILGVVGMVVVGAPLMVVGIALHVFGPAGPVGTEHHPVFWLAVSAGTGFAMAIAALGISAAVRAGRADYMWTIFFRVAERERDLLDEVERELAWLDEEAATASPPS